MIQGLYPIFDHWHRQGTVHIFSDPHFNDPDLAYIKGRPTAEAQIRMINSKVGKKDTLIILGDIGDIECAKRLKGYKILICGNHDAGISLYQRKKVSKKFDKAQYQKDEAIVEMQRLYPKCSYTISEGYDFHSPFEYWEVIADTNLFDEVYSGPLMIGEKLILSHEPLSIDWAFNIHGHCHSTSHKNDKYHFNCCAEAIGYLPVNFNQWMKEGYLKPVQSIHRDTIDKATVRKQKRGGKKIHEEHSMLVAR